MVFFPRRGVERWVWYLIHPVPRVESDTFRNDVCDGMQVLYIFIFHNGVWCGLGRMLNQPLVSSPYYQICLRYIKITDVLLDGWWNHGFLYNQNEAKSIPNIQHFPNLCAHYILAFSPEDDGAQAAKQIASIWREWDLPSLDISSVVMALTLTVIELSWYIVQQDFEMLFLHLFTLL